MLRHTCLTNLVRRGNDLVLEASVAGHTRLVTQGLTDAQVSEQLVISPRTVNTHLKSIYSKIPVTSRSAATRYAVEHQLL